MDESGKPSTYCVRGFTVETVTETDKPVTVKAKKECGSVVAQRTGATRGLGEDCPKGKTK
jgi:hypothetical protein